MILMTLGWFPFSLPTAAYDSLRRRTNERWAENKRMGQMPGYQHLGPGDDTMSLSGVLRPEITGGPSNIDKLRQMMAEGKAWILVSGQGEIVGTWIIKSVDDTSSHFLPNGQARKIEFSLELTRTDDRDLTQLGNLPASLVRTVASRLL